MIIIKTKDGRRFFEQVVEKSNGELSYDVFDNEDWAENLTDSELKALIRILVNNPELNRVEASVEFTSINRMVSGDCFDNVLSRLYAVEVSRVSEDRGYAWASLCASKQEFQSKIGKETWRMNMDETRDLLKFYPLPPNVSTLINTGFYLKHYREYIIEKGDFSEKEIKNIWAGLIISNFVTEVYSGEKMKDDSDLITQEDLIALAEAADSLQEGIIPLLIFEGVQFLTTEESELTNLKKQDFDAKKETVRVSNRFSRNKFGAEREIFLGKTISELAEDAAYEREMYHSKRQTDVPLVDSQYVFRGFAENSTAKMDVKASHTLVLARIRRMSNLFEEQFGKKGFSNKKLVVAGKVWHTQKYLEEGFVEKEAYEQTLKRFGEWRILGNEKLERDSTVNNTLMQRLKRIMASNNANL